MQKKQGIFMIFLTALLSGCSFHEETEEIINLTSTDTDTVAKDFVYYAKECTKGHTEYAPLLINVYVRSILQSMPDSKFTLFPKVPEVTQADTDKLKDLQNSIKEPFYYQQRKFNTPYETCLQKTMHDGHPEFQDFFVTKAFVSAKISQTFYKEKKYTEGADWAQRVINLHGKKMGYYLLGLFFIDSDETANMGADFFKESALLGNEGARQYIDNQLLNFNIFQKVRDKEQGKTDAINFLEQKNNTNTRQPEYDEPAPDKTSPDTFSDSQKASALSTDSGNSTQVSQYPTHP